MSFHLRWMIHRDLPQVLEIERLSFVSPWTEDNFLRHLKRRDTIGMVVEDAETEKIVGFMLYVLHKDGLDCINLAVHPDHRRKGVAGRMIAKLKYKLTTHNRRHLVLQLREHDLTKARQALEIAPHGFRINAATKPWTAWYSLPLEEVPKAAELDEYQPTIAGGEGGAAVLHEPESEPLPITCGRTSQAPRVIAPDEVTASREWAAALTVSRAWMKFRRALLARDVTGQVRVLATDCAELVRDCEEDYTDVADLIPGSDAVQEGICLWEGEATQNQCNHPLDPIEYETVYRGVIKSVDTDLNLAELLTLVPEETGGADGT